MIDTHQFQWLETGDSFYAAMLAAINSARETIRLETYIFAAGETGDKIRAALTRALERGVRAKVLIDAFGSIELPRDYWAQFTKAGGKYKTFNPLHFSRLSFRDHRKMLVCDSRVAIVGGFNISNAETGDGITHGWRDIGLRIEGTVASELAVSFDNMFDHAEFKHRRLQHLRLPKPYRQRKFTSLPTVCLLISQPGGWLNPIKRSLLADFKRAQHLSIISAYFLPSLRFRRAMRRVARRGGDVRVINAGKTDVPLARFAGRSLYHRLLHARISLFEYDAQVLHSKLIVTDNVVYVGSANLDNRSLNFNYELLIRIADEKVAQDARRIFKGYLPHCRIIEHDGWNKARSIWEKLLERLAHFALAHIDTYFATHLLGKLVSRTKHP